MAKILGLSGSLRNARFGAGNEKLVAELSTLVTEQDLVEFLAQQTKIRVEDFLEAGRKDGKPFDEVFQALGKLRGERGLSNSEASMAAALWGAIQEGAEIDHIALGAHFPPNGKIRNAAELKQHILDAQVLIISGPVYFGDRGSLVQSLFDFIASEPELKASMKGKLYAGLAVGAKRNGGQETTLIYQMLDMLQMGALTVGNGHETTAQYGGTAVGGDVGTLAKDAYGIETCIGTGRRAARVAEMMALGGDGQALKGKLRLHVWLLQDAHDRRGLQYFKAWARELQKRNPQVEATLFDVTAGEVIRCLACDVCPTHLGPREEYRCIITSADDFFVRHHRDLLNADALLVAAYSPEDRAELRSVYQQFIERTRYLRRDNYVFDDLLAAPFVVSELEARQHLHVRIATSMIRHQTVMHRPLIGYVQDKQHINTAQVNRTADEFVVLAQKLFVGRHRREQKSAPIYNPIGYEISLAKAREDANSGLTAQVVHEVSTRRTDSGRRRISG